MTNDHRIVHNGPSRSLVDPGRQPRAVDLPASQGGALPLTGSPIAAAATAGVLLLAAGAVTVLVVRRRKVRFTA
ncbi:LPXTG cell wall anchor domain-containing protein [Micromonospora sp. NPDC048930]|uniref:LPXTG cell wall anchor domain-containing protein n=1 Tax=Micromonospora sp. NPDC048930 TaxID=3364261 RepID=UPI003710EA44